MLQEKNKDVVRYLDMFSQHITGENKSIGSITYNKELEILAVARKRTIELWNCRHYPHKECQIIEIDSDSLEDIVWCGNTLYTAGFSGLLYQYSIDSLDITEKFPIIGGATWCLASSQNGAYIAAGTETGNVCIFEVNCNNATFKSFFKQNGRILSLAWHHNNKLLVAGSMNMVHLIDIVEEKSKTMHIQLDCEKTDISVHTIEILEDITIVTGDSRGYVSFLDGTMGTHLLSVKTHNAPVRSLMKAENDEVIYATGDDSSISQFKIHTQKNGTKEWIKNILGSCGKCAIFSMAYDKKNNSLFVAGEDAYLYRIFATPLGNLNVTSYPITPPMGYMSIAKHAQCLFLGTARKIQLYMLHNMDAVQNNSVGGHSYVLLKIQLKISSSLWWTAISSCAKSLAYIDTQGLHIIRVHYHKKFKNPKLLDVKLDNEVQCCRLIHFLNKHRLITAKSNVLQILEIRNRKGGRVASVIKTIELPDGAVRLIVASDNGEYFAVSNSQFDIYVFCGESLSYFKLPNKGVLPTAMTFDVTNRTICAAYTNSSLLEFDIANKKYTKFYSQFKNSYNEAALSNEKLPILTISYNDEDSILLHTIYSLIKVKKTEYDELDVNAIRLKRPKMDVDLTKGSFGKLITFTWDGHILLYNYLSRSEAVVLEVKREFIEKNAPRGKRKLYFSHGSV